MMSEQQGPGPAVFLRGESVYLRSVEPRDLPWIRKWANDPEVRALTGQVPQMTPAGAEEFLGKCHREEDRAWFMVVLVEGDRVIGEAGLLRMFPPWRTTDVSLILGERDAWGKGYGREAMLLLLDYAFGSLNFHRAAIGVVGFNERAIRFWEGVGFRREGIQRQGYYVDHAYHDFVMMSLLEDEFRSLYGRGGAGSAGKEG